MSKQITLHASIRQAHGKGASRRLRKADMVPAIIYGNHQDPVMAQLKHSELLRLELEGEHFFSAILNLNVDGQEESVLIRDYQRHPYKPRVMHVDLMRINMKEEISATVSLHTIGEDDCVGIKAGGMLQRSISELDIICMPKDLPESIEIDITELNVGDTIHLSEIKMPEGVKISTLQDLTEKELESANQAVVSIQIPKGQQDDEEEATTTGTEAKPDAE